jgi:rod shape-determining protein MreD
MRPALAVLAALVLLLVQSALVQVLPQSVPPPAFGILVVLHLGLSPRWSLIGQVALAFLFGYLFDLLAGAPHGTHALVYTVTVLAVGRLAQHMSVARVLPRMAACFLAALLAALAVVTIRAMVSRSGGFAGLRWAPIEALVTALLGPPVLALLARIEGKIEKQRVRGGLHRRKALGGGQLPLG